MMVLASSASVCAAEAWSCLLEADVEFHIGPAGAADEDLAGVSLLSAGEYINVILRNMQNGVVREDGSTQLGALVNFTLRIRLSAAPTADWVFLRGRRRLGPASHWWTNQLTSSRRVELGSQGLDAILDLLKDQFPPNPAEATASSTRPSSNCTTLLSTIPLESGTSSRRCALRAIWASWKLTIPTGTAPS